MLSLTNIFYLFSIVSILFTVWRYRKAFFMLFRVSVWGVDYFGVQGIVNRVEMKMASRFVKMVKRGKSNFLEVRYLYDGKWRYIDIPARKLGPLFSVLNGDGNSCYADLKNQLGPFNNFQGQYVTPLSLGYEALKFQFVPGPTLEFKDDERIML